MKLMVLLGPTAVGKTHLSIEIAKHYDCEIISGDSMQVYRGMDIGTAKIRPIEMAGIAHHMIDIVDPQHAFSAAAFQEQTRTVIADITARNKLPLLVGGTGLYIESLLYGYNFAETSSDSAVRRELEQFAAQFGEHALHDRLAAVDPVAAERLHPHDVRRVVRALEIFQTSGQPMTARLAQQAKRPIYHHCLIGLTRDREQLYSRINRRVDEMMNEGFEAEVRRLLDVGCNPDSVAMQALGYKEMALHLLHGLPLSETVDLIKQKTRQFAKRQWSWFRHMQEIRWINLTSNEKTVDQLQEISGIIETTYSAT